MSEGRKKPVVTHTAGLFIDWSTITVADVLHEAKAEIEAIASLPGASLHTAGLEKLQECLDSLPVCCRTALRDGEIPGKPRDETAAFKAENAKLKAELEIIRAAYEAFRNGVCAANGQQFMSSL